MSGVAVEVRGLGKLFRKGGKVIRVLSGVNVDLKPGETVAVVGPSGSGKSTFMHMLGLLDRPTTGSLRFNGKDVARMPAGERDRMRNGEIGFVFQAHNLLPDHSALGNVMMPVRLAGAPVRVAETRARALLTAVGLRHRLTHKPGELSGGEQQRVAIARALVMGPGLVLADEPTGNLDPATADGVFELFVNLNRQLGSTLIVVTHSMALARRFPRRLVLHDGRFYEETGEVAADAPLPSPAPAPSGSSVAAVDPNKLAEQERTTAGDFPIMAAVGMVMTVLGSVSLCIGDMVRDFEPSLGDPLQAAGGVLLILGIPAIFRGLARWGMRQMFR